MEQSILEKVAAFYDAHPYPPVSLFSPLFMGLRRDDLPLLNYHAGYAACFGSISKAPKFPKILVAGSGTFEAIAVAYANPGAEILAVDISAKALKKLAWLARWRGLNIKTQVCDLNEVQGSFDYIVSTGVLHHLEDPCSALQHLVQLGSSHLVLRLMVYSKWGRDLLYKTKAFAQLTGVKDAKGLRKLIASLPDDHPYKMYFHLYSDTLTDAGLADGYLHPCDTPFTADSLRGFLDSAGLEPRKFLHRPEGQPEHYKEFSHLEWWKRLSLLELYGDLEENFSFFAAKKETRPSVGDTAFTWNPALAKSGNLKSKLLGEHLKFDQRSKREMEEEEKDSLIEALFLLPGGL